jgi:hypothetical protein
MSNKLIALIVGIFMLIVAGMFGFAYLKKAEAPATIPTAEIPASTTDVYGITHIDGKHFFADGVHTIVGELSLPTACDLLTATSTVTAVPQVQVVLDFTVINHSTDCAKQATTARFKVTATASSSAVFNARFMVKDVELNLTEAAPGETPEQFEMYTKG